MTRLSDIKALPVSDAVRKLNPGLFGGPGLTGKEPLSVEHQRLMGKPLPAIKESLIVPPAGPRYRSKWEAQFHEVLKARFHGPNTYVEHEPMRLKIGRKAYYKPDFLTVNPYNILTFWEVKGMWREAARVRIKVAASKYPWARFIAVVKQKKKDGGGWKEEAFQP